MHYAGRTSDSACIFAALLPNMLPKEVNGSYKTKKYFKKYAHRVFRFLRGVG